jgi:hypothetical protein
MSSSLFTRFGHSYYTVNALIAVSFLAVRFRLGHKISPAMVDQEKGMWGIFFMFMAMRFKKLASLEAFFAMIFLYSKILMLFTLYLIDQRLAIVYATLFISTMQTQLWF